MPEAVRPAIAQGILGLNESELRRAIVDGRLRERRDGWIVAASIAEYVSGRVL